jgi:hypothetical protein
MPENGQEVLILTTGYSGWSDPEIYYATFQPLSERDKNFIEGFSTNVLFCCCMDDLTGDVAFWMPLPNRPK